MVLWFDVPVSFRAYGSDAKLNSVAARGNSVVTYELLKSVL